MNTSCEQHAIDYVITIAKLSGTRERAIDLTHALPNDLSQSAVLVDATIMAAVAQGFADELCKQLSEVRNAERVIIRGGTDKFRKYITDSARRRKLATEFIVEGFRTALD